MRGLLCIAIALLTSASASGAELGLFGGYRTGGPSVEIPVFLCIGFCEQPSVEAGDSESFGLVLDLPFRDQLMFEILISHQSGEFEGDILDHRVFLESILPPQREAHFDLTFLHAGLLRQWRTGKVSPFAAVGIGIAQLESDQPQFFFNSIDEDRLSASLAGGIKVRLNEWLGVRLEGRGYWADMPAVAGDDLFQLELSSGLTFKL